MFRTKSLSSKQMQGLIDRNRPQEIYKQNRNHSLRSLIADKTMKYHKHMQRLVQDVNDSCVLSSNKKNRVAYSSPNQIFKDVSNTRQQNSDIRQFCPLESLNQISNITKEEQSSQNNCIVVESMPTYFNQQKIEEEQQHKDFSCLRSSGRELQQKSAFRVTLQNQQLTDENKQLRRQIQYLQQRLQTAQLIKIQKESQAESLKLKIKIMQLKIQDLEQTQEQRHCYHNKFTTSKPMGITIVRPDTAQIGIQSSQTSKQIQQMLMHYARKQKQLQIIEPQLAMVANYVGELVEELQIQVNVQQHNQPNHTYNKLVQLIEYYKCGKQQDITKQIASQQQCKQWQYRYEQLQQQYGQLQQQYQINQKNYAQIQQEYRQLQIKCGQIQIKWGQAQQKYEQLKHRHAMLQQKYKGKVANLVNMLQLAQNQIKVLLSRLRQAKDTDVANYKQLITQSYRLPFTQLTKIDTPAQTQ